MKTLVLANFHLLPLTCVALVLFFTVFTGMLVWVFRKSSKELYAGIAALPLNEDKK